MNTHEILSYLPRPRIAEFPKGYAIYGAERPAEHLHLVISGYIKVLSTARDGRRLLLRIVPRDGMFGECALVPAGLAMRQSAVALDRVQAMSWSTEEVQRRVESQPKLALALIEHFAQSNCLLKDRVKMLAGFTTGPRVILRGAPTGPRKRRSEAGWISAHHRSDAPVDCRIRGHFA